jgi:hypothetical protein
MPEAGCRETVPTEAADARIHDLEGEERRLSSLWAEAPVVAIWVRHFG